MQVRDLIGKPWAIPCQPPHSYDCWEIAVEVRKRLGLMTPLYEPIETRTEAELPVAFDGPFKREWVETDQLVKGTLVTFGDPITHCGVMISDRDVLHTSGKGATEVLRLPLVRRFFGVVQFWELKT